MRRTRRQRLVVVLVVCVGYADQRVGAEQHTTADTGSVAPVGRGVVQAVQGRARRGQDLPRRRVSVTEKGETFAADIGYGTIGSHGTMTVGGDKVEILTVDNAFYLRAPDRLWRKKFGAEADRALAILSGKWLKLSTTDKQFAEFAEFGSRDGFVRSMLGDWVTKPRKTGEKTIGGVHCIGLTGTDGTLWINKVDARPVQLESDTDSSTRGRMTFSDYNTVTEPKAPPTSTTIDITKLRN
jgi:hypothetical protein